MAPNSRYVSQYYARIASCNLDLNAVNHVFGNTLVAVVADGKPGAQSATCGQNVTATERQALISAIKERRPLPPGFSGVLSSQNPGSFEIVTSVDVQRMQNNS